MLEKPRTMALYPKGSATGFTPSLPGDGRERFQEKPGKVGSGWIEVFKEQWELGVEKQQQAGLAGNEKLIFSKGKHKIPSATEGRAGRKAGGCLGNEQDAREWMTERHPTHIPHTWCQLVSRSSHLKKCYYVVRDNFVFSLGLQDFCWSWQWALLLTTERQTNQQSPRCLGKKLWLGGDLWGPQSNLVHNTNSNTSTLFLYNT